MLITPRSEILSLSLAAHGGRLALANGGVKVRHDFSVCLNAYGPAAIVKDAIRATPFDEYPDPRAAAPRAAAASRWGCALTQIIFGAGAAELIHLVCFVYLRAGDRAVIATPAFGEYERAVRLCGAHASFVDVRKGNTGEDSLISRLCDAVEQSETKLVFVCNPSNPMGYYLAPKRLSLLADACENAGALLVLDQAYDAFTEHPLPTPTAGLGDHDAVLYLKSITKDHALAGVRAAFAIGAESVIRAMTQAQIPWSASSMAHSAAVAAMSDVAQRHVEYTIRKLRAEAQRVAQGLRQLGYPVAQSSTHFFLVDVGNASIFRERLLEHYGILVRDCTSFGLPSHIRLAARTPDENDALLDAFARINLPSTVLAP